MRFVSFALRVFITIATAILSAFLACLLFAAQTWTGRALLSMGLVAVVLPATTYLAWRQEKPHRFWIAAAIATAIGTVALLGVILSNTPSGAGLPGSPVQHRFTTPTEFHRFSLSNIVPEIEQVNLGFLLMPYVDPILTRAQASRVSDFTVELYREMERDPDFHELGSAMGFAYADLLGQSDVVGHYYLYIPRNRGEDPLPAFVFLHGSAAISRRIYGCGQNWPRSRGW
jgi:hypothetical protein